VNNDFSLPMRINRLNHPETSAKGISMIPAFRMALTLGFAVLSWEGAASAQEYSLRFYGHGVSAPDLDRVKIPVDDPGNANPGPPADLGGDDFTIEFFLKGSAADNTAPGITCGSNVDWITGNIVFDRDRFNQDRKFGISLAGGEVVFGVSGDGTGDRTICGSTNVLDNAWHHVAVQRRRSDGRMWLYVDGVLEAEADGPDGDISYPDAGVPCGSCCDGGPCTGSDPFIVLAAEKHDAGAAYPSFSGLLDELRLSSALRYTSSFAPPTAPFVDDADTAALFHFDEGPAGPCTGAIVDAAAGAQSPGFCQYGGSAPAGPLYSTDTAFEQGPTAHDAYLDALQPLTVKIQPDKDGITKRIRIKVWNGSTTAGSGQTIQLAVTSLDCPGGTVAGAPDFDGRTAGDQDTVTLGAGRTASARLTLDIDGASFTTFNRRVPTRCTLQFTANSTAPGNVDPTPDNNVAYMELNVFDLADPEQGAVHESLIDSFRATHPGKIEIRAGQTGQTKIVKPVVINGDADEHPGDVLTVSVDDGNCPPGTVGLVDFDSTTAGAQTSVVVVGQRKARGSLAITVDADDFYSPGRRALARCHATLTVAGPGGDTDASNNTTRMVINVFDRNDL
jgi:hypothetical protein